MKGGRNRGLSSACLAQNALTDAGRREIVFAKLRKGVPLQCWRGRFGAPRCGECSGRLKGPMPERLSGRTSVIHSGLQLVRVKVTALRELAVRSKRVFCEAGIESRAEGLRRLILGGRGGVVVPDAQIGGPRWRAGTGLSARGWQWGRADSPKQMTPANSMGQGAEGSTSAEPPPNCVFLAQTRGLARFQSGYPPGRRSDLSPAARSRWGCSCRATAALVGVCTCGSE